MMEKENQTNAENQEPTPQSDIDSSASFNHWKAKIPTLELQCEQLVRKGFPVPNLIQSDDVVKLRQYVVSNIASEPIVHGNSPCDSVGSLAPTTATIPPLMRDMIRVLCEGRQESLHKLVALVHNFFSSGTEVPPAIISLKELTDAIPLVCSRKALGSVSRPPNKKVAAVDDETPDCLWVWEAVGELSLLENPVISAATREDLRMCKEQREKVRFHEWLLPELRFQISKRIKAIQKLLSVIKDENHEASVKAQEALTKLEQRELLEMEAKRIKEEKRRNAEAQRLQKADQKRQKEEEKQEEKRRKEEERKQLKTEQGAADRKSKQDAAEATRRKAQTDLERMSANIMNQWLVKRPSIQNSLEDEKTTLSRTPLSMRYLKNVTSKVNLREWWGIHGGLCDPLVVDAGSPTLFVEDTQFPLRFADFGSVVRQQHDDLKQILRLKDRQYCRTTPVIGASRAPKEHVTAEYVAKSQNQTPYNDSSCKDLQVVRRVVILNGEWEKRPAKRLLLAKAPKAVNLRAPLLRESHIQYDADSDEEWEEKFGGEDVGNTKDDDSDKEDDDLEALGGWMVSDDVVDYEVGGKNEDIDADALSVPSYVPVDATDAGGSQAPVTVGIYGFSLRDPRVGVGSTGIGSSIVVCSQDDMAWRTVQRSFVFRDDIYQAAAKCFDLLPESKKRNINRIELKELAKSMHGRIEGRPRVVDDFSKSYPNLIKRSVEEAYRKLAVREKRGSDSKARSYVRQEWVMELGLLEALCRQEKKAEQQQQKNVSPGAKLGQNSRRPLLRERQSLVPEGLESVPKNTTKKRAWVDRSPSNSSATKLRKTATEAAAGHT
eukprot:GHVN01000757.1.p1 GENE.GHVN01000757.1~~GHVN01000757.1.p1  ORF type:complete len:831 (-),score=107.21 GHVN01000757.1:3749-6241(-)